MPLLRTLLYFTLALIFCEGRLLTPEAYNAIRPQPPLEERKA